jgi:hypothetical protein
MLKYIAKMGLKMMSKFEVILLIFRDAIYQEKSSLAIGSNIFFIIIYEAI